VDIKKLNQKLQRVPPHLIPEIIDYIDFLLSKYGINRNNKRKFKFKWSGGLSDIAKQYSSVELQHKAMDWR
jgi:hypothetical protein